MFNANDSVSIMDSSLNSRADAGMTVNYWDFFGFKQDPFLKKNIEEIYISPRWERMFDLISHTILTKNTLINVTGSKAIGKSTFIQAYLAQLEKNISVLSCNATQELTPEELLAKIVRKFHLSMHVPNPVTEETIDSCLTELQFSNQICLLMIDDAHQLSADCLEMMFYMVQHQSDTQMRFHIVLVGESQLLKRYQQLELDEMNYEFLSSLELTAFSLSETKSFLSYYFVQAGLPAAIPFSDQVFKKIHSLSKGLPSEVMRISQQKLERAGRNNGLTYLKEFISWHQQQLFGGLILLAILWVAFGLFAKSSHYKQTVVHRNLEQYSAESKILAESANLAVKDSTNAIILPVKQTPVINNALTFQGVLSIENLANKFEPFKAVPLNEHAKQENNLRVVISAAKNSVREMSMENNKQTTKQLALDDNTVEMNNQNPNISVVDKDIEDKEISSKQISPQKEQVVRQAAVSAKSVETAHKDRAGVFNAVENSTAKTTPVSTKVSNNQSNQYTLQLIGVSNEASMHHFVTTNKLADSAAYYQSALHGKNWYVVLYGQFPTQEAAEAAIKNLPAEVRQQKPWVRKLSTIAYPVKSMG